MTKHFNAMELADMFQNETVDYILGITSFDQKLLEEVAEKIGYDGLESGVDSGLGGALGSGVDSGLDGRLENGVDSGLDGALESGVDSGLDGALEVVLIVVWMVRWKWC